MPAPKNRRRYGFALLGVLVLALVVGKLCGDRATAVAARPMLTVLQALGPGPHDDGFARADRPREFRFPADHGAHPEFRNEWWYWTGNLTGPQGRAFGFELTVFRTALAPDQDPNRSSGWAPRDIYMAHFTISDLEAKRFYAFERTSRGALDLAGAKNAPWQVWVLDWSARGPDDRGAAFPMHLRAKDGDFAIDLSLEQGKPVVLEGDRGLSRKGPEPGNASYYYSLTRMPSAGSIVVGGVRYDVRGASWMDREWSTRALSGEQIGWDWFALRLDDGRELMFFHLRRRDGKKDAFSSGTLVENDGTPRPLRADDVALEPRGSFTSPHSRTTYPAGFRVLVPGFALDLQVIPDLADQELDLTFRYWEGAVRIAGTGDGKPVQGTGYLELTGYGDEPRQPR
jgi:predicted secreted hydrolase